VSTPIELEPIDRLGIIVLVDNLTDPLLTDMWKPCGTAGGARTR
jgi:hypothetical protein